MQGAGRAIGWSLGRHHRFGLVILIAYFAAFAAVRIWFPEPEARLQFDPPNALVAGIAILAVPLARVSAAPLALAASRHR